MQARKGFTLVELLTVIGILAILSAIFWPIIKTVKAAAFRYNASLSIRNLGAAVNIYMADSDETYPIAMSQDQSGFRAWFGAMRPDRTFDYKAGILSSYTKGRAAHDLIHKAKEYMGDHSGFGYNWGYVGSDVNITLDYSGFPNCYHPARSSELTNPKGTVLFATSVFYYAPWLPDGDGQKYDFGFIDPPKFWRGNPNVDFRHGEPAIIDFANKKVTPKGYAVLLLSSGGTRTFLKEKVTDDLFERGDPEDQVFQR